MSDRAKRNGIPREVISWECMPDLTDSDIQRLLCYWIGAALPHTHFECLGLKVERLEE